MMFPETPPSTAVEQTPAAESVAGNDDLVTTILLRLPLKSLTRSKAVSKHWLSLISDLQRSLVFTPPSALFLQAYGPDPETAFVPLSDAAAAVDSPKFDLLRQPNTMIEHSSNGLICFWKSTEHPDRTLTEYFVFNPTTNRSARIPVHGTIWTRKRMRGSFGCPTLLHKLCDSDSGDGDQQGIRVRGVYVAFDPLRLTHYRVICVSEFSNSWLKSQIKIAVYKPELASWSEQFGPFTVPYGLDYNNGVYWNGGMFWPTKTEFACFFLAGESLKVAAMPSSSRSSAVDYFGVSRDHLMAVVSERPWRGVLEVFEMGAGHSGWVYRYQCDVRPLVHGKVLRDRTSSFPLAFLARGDEGDESCLVLGVRDRVISYSLRTKTWKTMCDFASSRPEHWAWGVGFKVFPFDRTLYDV